MPSTKLAAAAPVKAAKAAKAKCVVCDLDNTMWKGMLIEDGGDALMLDPVAVNAVRELDRRGVLNSIASKNNADDALAALDRFGLRDYFLHPQISWGQKSQSIAEIARRLNIGTYSLVFIDDQPFERAEVQAAHPDIPVIDAAELGSLLARPRFDVPVTAESQARRSMYRDEISRDQALAQSAGDYLAFLRGCSLTLTIARLTPETVQRTHELAQRTNQMNFSGSRYSVANIEHMLSYDRLDAYVLRASDRFGDYGMIGFAVVDRDEAMLRDLMFSCWIQGKHVDRALLTCLLGRYRSAAPGAPFRAIYRETDKNRPAAQLFWDLCFEKIESDGNRHTLGYDVSRRGLPQQDIVTVVAE